MKDLIRILYIEDNIADAELISFEVTEYLDNAVLDQCNNKEKFIEFLENKKYDIILSDYNIPGFQGLEIYNTVRKYDERIPFIFVSGTIGEERAVELLKSGVTDYVLKDNKSKLPHSIIRALKEYNQMLEKEEAEVKLRESELFKDSIINSVSSQIAVLNQSGEIFGSNERWKEFVETFAGKEAVESNNFWEIIKDIFTLNDELMVDLRDKVKKVFIGEVDYTYEDYVVSGEGEEKWYTIRITPFQGLDKVIVNLINVTERKLSELKIRESEKKYRSLFESMNEGFIMISPNGQIVLTNRKFSEMTGYDFEELSADDKSDLIGSILPHFFTKDQMDRQKKGGAETYETELLQKSGKKLWVSISASSQFNTTGQFLGSILLIKDITEKKLADAWRGITTNLAVKISSAQLSLTDLIDFARDELNNYMDTENFYLALKKDENAIEFMYFEDEYTQMEVPFSRTSGNGLTEFVITEGTPLLLSGKELTEIQEKNGMPVYGHLAKNWLGVPLYRNNEVIGAIACQSYDNVHAYNEFHLQLLSYVGRQLGLFVDRIKVEEDKNRILNLSDDLICIIGKEGTMKYVNPAFSTILGYKEEEILQQSMFKFISLADRKESEKWFRQGAEDGHAWKFTNRIIKKDGGERTISWSVSPMVEEGMYYCIGRDITVQKNIQDRVVQSEKRYRGIFERMREGLMYSDKEGRIEVVNPGLCEMLEYEPEELVGEVGYELLHDKSTGERLRSKLKYRRQGDAAQYETEFITKSGKTIWAQVSAAPYYNSDDEFIGVMSIIMDITDRKIAEMRAMEMKEVFTKQLEDKVEERTHELNLARKELAQSLEKEKELGELKSHFVSMASHQFRTPLSVIQTSMGILAMQMDAMNDEFKPKFEKVYTRIKQQIERMTDLMNDVLILGKINTGNIAIRIQPTNLVDLCATVSNSYGDIYKKKNLELKVNGDPWDIYIDPSLFEHSFSNIVSNALKYSPDGSTTKVEITFNGTLVNISVKDQGIGIPKEELDNLFEPFFRASNVKEISGTGLGTTIAKEYIELIGGEIDVSSEQNKGTEFIITFKKEGDGKIVDS